MVVTIDEVDSERKIKRHLEKTRNAVKGRWDEGFSMMVVRDRQLLVAFSLDGQEIGNVDLNPLKTMIDSQVTQGNLGEQGTYHFSLIDQGTTVRVDHHLRPSFWAEIPLCLL